MNQPDADLGLEVGDAGRIAEATGYHTAYVRQVARGIRTNATIEELLKLASTDRVAFEKKRKALREKSIRSERKQAAQ